jgi:hypothetical protein
LDNRGVSYRSDRNNLYGRAERVFILAVLAIRAVPHSLDECEVLTLLIPTQIRYVDRPGA